MLEDRASFPPSSFTKSRQIIVTMPLHENALVSILSHSAIIVSATGTGHCCLLQLRPSAPRHPGESRTVSYWALKFLDLILKEFVCEFEICLPTVHPVTDKLSVEKIRVREHSSRNSPGRLIVEETVGALFELLRDVLRFLMPLEPSLVLLVESPRLILQRLGSQVLLVCTLLVIKRVE